MKESNLFTSESVSPGHPDKICDQISDIILDAALKDDKNSRVAIETFASNRVIMIGGELTTTAYIDIIKKAWTILFKLGYKENDFTIMSAINSQSSDIKKLVDNKEGDLGAGDQGIVFGYATDENTWFMPTPILIANAILEKAEKIIIEKSIPELKSDMKSQVTFKIKNHKFTKLHSVLISAQHKKNIDLQKFRDNIKKQIIIPTLEKFKLNLDAKIYVNPKGAFSIGGPEADTGLTGRKTIVDTYGGVSRHGGGSFSGKDYTKIDRSGAYVARWIAKNLVAAGVAKRLEIQLSYIIGQANPSSIFVETFNTKKISLEKIYKIIENIFDLSVQGIIDQLNLKDIEYLPTATFGHFGRTNLNFPWEKLDKVDEIKKILVD